MRPRIIWQRKKKDKKERKRTSEAVGFGSWNRGGLSDPVIALPIASFVIADCRSAGDRCKFLPHLINSSIMHLEYIFYNGIRARSLF